jgi:hypothetical protein
VLLLFALSLVLGLQQHDGLISFCCLSCPLQVEVSVKGALFLLGLSLLKGALSVSVARKGSSRAGSSKSSRSSTAAAMPATSRRKKDTSSSNLLMTWITRQEVQHSGQPLCVLCLVWPLVARSKWTDCWNVCLVLGSRIYWTAGALASQQQVLLFKFEVNLLSEHSASASDADMSRAVCNICVQHVECAARFFWAFFVYLDPIGGLSKELVAFAAVCAGNRRDCSGMLYSNTSLPADCWGGSIR